MFIGRHAERTWLENALKTHPLVFIHGLKGVGKKTLVQTALKNAPPILYLKSPLSIATLLTDEVRARETLIFADFHKLTAHERLLFVDELRGLQSSRTVVLSDRSVDLEIDFSIPRLNLKPFSHAEFSELVAVHKPGLPTKEIDELFEQCLGVPLLVNLWLLGNLDLRAVEASFFGKLSREEQELLRFMACFEDGLEDSQARDACEKLKLDSEEMLSRLKSQYLITDSVRIRVNAPFLNYVGRLQAALRRELIDVVEHANDIDRVALELCAKLRDEKVFAEALFKVTKGSLQRLDASYLKFFVSLVANAKPETREHLFHMHSLELAALVLTGDRMGAIARAREIYETELELRSDDFGAEEARFLVDLVNLMNRSSREDDALPIAKKHLHQAKGTVHNELVLEFIVAHKDLASKATFERLQSLLKSLADRDRVGTLGSHVRFQLSRNRGLNKNYKESAALLAENYQAFLRQDQTYDAGFAGFNVALMLHAANLDEEAWSWIGRVEQKVKTPRFPYLHFGLTLLKASLKRRKGELHEALRLLTELKPAFESLSLPVRAKRDFAKEYSLVSHLLGRHKEGYSIHEPFDFSVFEKLECLSLENVTEIPDSDLTRDDLSIEAIAHAKLLNLREKIPSELEKHPYVDWAKALSSDRGEHIRAFSESVFSQALGAKSESSVADQDVKSLIVAAQEKSLPEGALPHPFWELLRARWTKERAGYWVKTNDRFFSDENWSEHLTSCDLALVDFENRVAIKGKDAADFRSKRILFKMLRLLLENYPNPVSKESLVQSLWGEAYDPLMHDSRIYATAQRLREKLRKNWMSTTEAGYVLSSSVRFVFVVSSQPETIDLKWLEQRILRIFRDLKSGDMLSRADLAQQLKTSDASLKRALLHLTQAGRIRKLGSGPNTQYQLAA